jgi:hypothetical protein
VLRVIKSLVCVFFFFWSESVLATVQDKNKNPTAENVAEMVIYVHGSRERLIQIRRNGVERGKINRLNEEGRSENVTYERRFIKGQGTNKDKVRIDHKIPNSEYALVYSEGRVWGVVNGVTFAPKPEASSIFLAQVWHEPENLLRYKENGATLTFVNKDKQKNIEMYVIDLVDKEKHRTRFYISSKTGRILWLEYEQALTEGAKPHKFKKTFHDYRVAQGTLVPYRTVLFQDGKQVQETNIQTITFGVKLDESVFSG